MPRSALSLLSAVALAATVSVAPVVASPSDDSPSSSESPSAVTVERLAGENRYATAADVSDQWSATDKRVYVVSGHNFPDALVAASRAGVFSAPVLLTKSDHLPSKTRSALERLQPERIVVIGGEGSVSDTVISELDSYAGAEGVERLTGENRYATSARIASQYTKNRNRVFLASGENYPDALSAAAVAGTEHEPLLLTKPGHLPSVIAEQLQRLAPEQVVVVGGPKAISDAVAKEAAGYSTSETFHRVAGEDRYKTSAAVAKEFTPDLTPGYVASGLDYADALVVSALAARDEVPVVLTPGDRVASGTREALNHIAPSRIYVAGGPQAVAGAVVEELRDPETPPAPQPPAPPPGTERRVEVWTTEQLVSAIKSATPGTAIMLHKGTYTGPFDLLKSGTSTAPISIQPYGDGAVKLTANLEMPPCNATGPDINRTIRFRQAASYWVIQGLTIDGGIYIPGKGVQQAYNWMQVSINNGDWETLRAVPGRGENDPAAADNAITYVAAQSGTTLQPIDGVQIRQNKITGKGIHVTMSRYGTITNNTITDVACGVGPGIWFGTYSDGWTVTNNTIDRIEQSTAKHYMQEGIRVDNGSNYNLIENNDVKNLPGDGRAFTTDQTASFNTFTQNNAANVNIGFNEQMAGWGNEWTHNTATNYREAGMSFRMMDSPLEQPSKSTSIYESVVTCNIVSGDEAGIKVGAMSGSMIADNEAPSITFGPNVASYWVAQKNTYNGAAVVPPLGVPTEIRPGSC